MTVKFTYRENGSPKLECIQRDGTVVAESEPVDYQGVATLRVSTSGNVYVAVGDYWDGHPALRPGAVYLLVPQV